MQKKSPNLYTGTTLSAKSPAKINLTLDILQKVQTRHGEYHRINTIMREIPLYDELVFQEIPGHKIIIKCADPKVPKGRENTIYKAITALKKIRATSRTPTCAALCRKSPCTPRAPTQAVSAKEKSGLLITLKKNIPVSSGLGGGAGNAAAALIVLNRLWRLHLSPKKMRVIAAEIGMDVPFFLKGGTALLTHYGEEITPLPKIKLPPLLIVINSRKQSTGEIYRMIDSAKTGLNRQKTAKFISALKSGKIPDPELFHNDFETLAAAGIGEKCVTLNDAYMRKIIPLQKKLLCLGADVVHISGSGPALYALFKTQKALRKAFKALSGKVKFIWREQK